jgi:glycosyltransferase involved in cell wall biosynthesis
MRIAFYAPMKPPDHPLPSGDRQVGRLLMQALALGGHDVFLASHHRSWDGEGCAAKQQALQAAGLEEAKRLIGLFRAKPASERPAIWFTYHLYYKAPDWIGPAVAAALSIPYVVAEASVAYKRAGGPWDPGHRQVIRALEQAAAVITLNPGDAECLPTPDKSRLLPPFLDPALYERAESEGKARRGVLARKHHLDPAQPWLLAVAMMREGDKLASYRVLSEALGKIEALPWTLLIAGDGPAAAQVRSLFQPFSRHRVAFLGAVEQAELPPLYGACDLLVWPAVREAYGMALLEAQASGLPVLAGRSPGVAAISAEGISGVLVEVEAFAEALGKLLEDPDRRGRLAEAARPYVLQNHSLEAAAARLNRILIDVAAA